jgi:hypothetical protein
VKELTNCILRKFAFEPIDRLLVPRDRSDTPASGVAPGRKVSSADVNREEVRKRLTFDELERLLNCENGDLPNRWRKVDITTNRPPFWMNAAK